MRLPRLTTGLCTPSKHCALSYCRSALQGGEGFCERADGACHNLAPLVSRLKRGRLTCWGLTLSEHPVTRLYIAEPLAEGGAVTLGSAQAHRLQHVLRLGPGAFVAGF